MQLHFKEERYNWGDKFFVMDPDDQRKYRVKSSVLLWNRKFQIFDMDKNLLVTIQNDPKSLLKKKYRILIGDQEKAVITREISVVPKYTFEGLGWTMRGVMRHEYDLLEGDREVVSFHTENTGYGYRPVLKIADGVEELLALAVVMTLTYVFNAGDGDPASKY